MSTVIRPDISKKNKYWISKHRYYELKHWCLQYPEWKEMYLYFGNLINRYEKHDSNRKNSPVEYLAEQREYYKKQMDLIRQCSELSDPSIGCYIFKAVTQELSFVNLETHGIPCGRDMYYDRYRKFFWILSRKKQSFL